MFGVVEVMLPFRIVVEKDGVPKRNYFKDFSIMFTR